MINEQRLTEIGDLVEASQRRLSPERAHALLVACRQLLTEVVRLRSVPTRPPHVEPE